MKKIILLVLLALTLVSCGGSSSTASSVNTNYANTFTVEELDSIESAYKTAFAIYQTQNLLLSLIVEPMTFITTQNTGHSNYDASFEHRVYLSKANNKFIVTENSASVSYNTIDTALENCF